MLRCRAKKEATLARHRKKVKGGRSIRAEANEKLHQHPKLTCRIVKIVAMTMLATAHTATTTTPTNVNGDLMVLAA